MQHVLLLETRLHTGLDADGFLWLVLQEHVSLDLVELLLHVELGVRRHACHPLSYLLLVNHIALILHLKLEVF